jgi:hypothetical protein
MGAAVLSGGDAWMSLYLLISVGLFCRSFALTDNLTGRLTK